MEKRGFLTEQLLYTVVKINFVVKGCAQRLFDYFMLIFSHAESFGNALII